MAVAFLASCGQDDRERLAPEADHCARAVERLIRADVHEGGHPTILDVQTWTGDDVRNVRVRYEYPPNPNDFERGTILCTYDFAYEIRNDPNRRAQATSVYFRGRNLATNELLLLNAALRGLEPDYRIKK